MKIVFLDIDGVLNNEATKFGRKFDPDCVAWLNYITDSTGAQIVVSSTWRHAGLVETRATLSENGVTGKVHSLTPDLSSKGLVHVAVERGTEIQAWLGKHPGVDSFVILDDDDDMGALAGRLVQTISRLGLVGYEAIRAAAILGQPTHGDSK